MNIYLDDERSPKTKRDWTIVRSVPEAIALMLEHGLPDYMSFDHDLGENEKTGYDLAKWMYYAVLYKMVKINPNFDFNVHSANPIGAKAIQHRLEDIKELIRKMN